MKIFLDTNVILDCIIPGRRYEYSSARILSIRNTIDISICISILSVADIAYILRKMESRDKILQRLRILLDKCKVLPMNDMQLYKALGSLTPDFEDALQMSCAWMECCDCIITGNVQHFGTYTTIPVYTPEEFLDKADSSHL